MAQTHKSFGRSTPGAGATVTLYTATGVTGMLTCLHICNTNTTADLVHIFIVPSGGSAGVTNAIMYNLIIPEGIPFLMNSVVVLMNGDFLAVYSRDGHTTFTASGLEIV